MSALKIAHRMRIKTGGVLPEPCNHDEIDPMPCAPEIGTSGVKLAHRIANAQQNRSDVPIEKNAAVPCIA
eukprot:3020359-Rhodomonas_salina.1